MEGLEWSNDEFKKWSWSDTTAVRRSFLLTKIGLAISCGFSGFSRGVDRPAGRSRRQPKKLGIFGEVGMTLWVPTILSQLAS